MEEDRIFAERKEKILKFVKQKYSLITYLLLAIIVWISIHIRIRNLPGLKDVTTNSWTLGPDLDPFLFLRWAKEIVANGSISTIDTLRYVPLGFNTRGELLLLPYMIAWFHKVATIFGSNSVEQSAVLFPVFMFALTVIAFFFLVRKIFLIELGVKRASAIALISSLFLSILPSLLPRTIAGIPEKESAAFLFMFLAFYLFLCAWQSNKIHYQLLLAFFAGISTAAMAWIWGGFVYILVTVSLALLIYFFIGQIDKNKFVIALVWLFSTYVLMTLISTRYSLEILISSTTTLIPLFVMSLITLHLILFYTPIKKYFEKPLFSKYPKQLISFVALLLLGTLLGSILFGPSFIIDKLNDIKGPLITPVTDRLGVTVAENRQPFFSEWESSFGPHLNGIAIFFWLFFVGSVYLCYKMLHMFDKKERLILTCSYFYFLLAIIFSRYESSSLFNGTNTISILFYLSGVLILLGTFSYYYYNHHKNSNESIYSKISFEYILLFSLFFFSIVSARGSVRTIMVLVPSASIMVGFLIVSLASKLNFKNENRNIYFLIGSIVVIALSLYSGYYFYQASMATADSYVPSVYTQQWQYAMSWVRDSTPKDAVFAHWWDYGYWVQSIGERATVLDGGNVISYWNHLMGRYALTGTSEREALEFLYSHNVTHFLIDSTDIGKYPAFSSIGSDENYDRYSWLPVMLRDPNQIQEKKNSTVLVYSGGSPLDQDLLYDMNGTNIFLPANRAAIAAVIIEIDQTGEIITQPQGIFVYQSNQYYLPLRYYFDEELIDYENGVDAGVFIFPRFTQNSANAQIDENGALIYLSNRTVNSQLARLYLFNQENPYFKLAHSEDDILIKQIKTQTIYKKDFVYFDGLRGPLRIWEVNYPQDLEVKSEYLSKEFPSESLQIATR